MFRLPCALTRRPPLRPPAPDSRNDSSLSTLPSRCPVLRSDCARRPRTTPKSTPAADAVVDRSAPPRQALFERTPRRRHRDGRCTRPFRTGARLRRTLATTSGWAASPEPRRLRHAANARTLRGLRPEIGRQSRPQRCLCCRTGCAPMRPPSSRRPAPTPRLPWRATHAHPRHPSAGPQQGQRCVPAKFPPSVGAPRPPHRSCCAETERRSPAVHRHTRSAERAARGSPSSRAPFP